MIRRLDLAGSFLVAVLLCAAPAAAESQAPCQTARDIEVMNRGGVKRLFELQGAEAKVFLALDPRMLMFEKEYDALIQQDIEAIVAWKLKQRGGRLAAAVPFVSGCAAEGYGEPDLREKVELMRDTAVLIGKLGLDDDRVLEKVKELVSFEPFSLAPEELERRAKRIIERVRRLH